MPACAGMTSAGRGGNLIVRPLSGHPRGRVVSPASLVVAVDAIEAGRERGRRCPPISDRSPIASGTAPARPRRRLHRQIETDGCECSYIAQGLPVRPPTKRSTASLVVQRLAQKWGALGGASPTWKASLTAALADSAGFDHDVSIAARPVRSRNRGLQAAVAVADRRRYHG
jgi:hypothetical protein